VVAIAGRHDTQECCSGISVDGVCACVTPSDDLPVGQDASSVCCSKEIENSACTCLSDGALLQKGTPASACCTNQTSHIISDACHEPPQKCGA
jgi:hypothetical protein